MRKKKIFLFDDNVLFQIKDRYNGTKETISNQTNYFGMIANFLHLTNPLK